MNKKLVEKTVTVYKPKVKVIDVMNKDLDQTKTDGI